MGTEKQWRKHPGWGSHYFVARVHEKGARKMIPLGDHQTQSAALKDAVTTLYSRDIYNRADVLRCQNFMSYYGPTVICEMQKVSFGLE